MAAILILGIIAAMCSTLASCPQLCRARRPKSTNDLHLWTLCIRTIGVFLWTLYGHLTREYVLLASSALACFIECLLLLAKLRDSCQ